MKYYCSFLLVFSTIVLNAQTGCTDPLAVNFDDSATENDGSCTYVAATINTTEVINPLPISLAEQSGMILENNELWIHLDGSNDQKFFILSLDDFSIDELNFQNIVNTDWEDIAEDNDNFYLGDFGNNLGNRLDLKIWKIAKSELSESDPEDLNPEQITFSYPEQTDFSDQNQNHDFDCEAMVVMGDHIYLFLKEWISNQSSIYRIPKESGNYNAEFLGVLDVNGLITGAGYNPNEGMILLIGYELGLGAAPFVYMLWDFPNDNFELGNKRRIDLNWFNHQTESICYSSMNEWYIGNEYFEFGPIAFFNQLRLIDIAEFLSPSIGLEEISNSTGIIRPNPGKENFNIGIDFTSISIYNLNGELIRILGSEDEIPNNLANGLYFINIIANDKMYREKILISD